MITQITLDALQRKICRLPRWDPPGWHEYDYAGLEWS